MNLAESTIDAFRSASVGELVRWGIGVLVIPAVAYVANGVRREFKTIKEQIMPKDGRSFRKIADDLSEALQILQTGVRFCTSIHNTSTWECSPDGGCIYASQGLCSMWGRSPDQMLGNEWLAAIPSSDDRDRVRMQWKLARETDSPYLAEYVVHNRVTGERILVRAEAMPARDKNGKVLRYYGTVEAIKSIRTTHESDI